MGGNATLDYKIPTRGLIGFSSFFLRTTRGDGIKSSVFLGYEPMEGQVKSTAAKMPTPEKKMPTPVKKMPTLVKKMPTLMKTKRMPVKKTPTSTKMKPRKRTRPNLPCLSCHQKPGRLRRPGF